MAERIEGAIPLRERRTLSDEWGDFSKAILPAGASEIQRVETRRAFYAGASSMLALISDGLDADKEATELDVQYVDSLAEKIVAFAKLLGQGLA